MSGPTIAVLLMLIRAGVGQAAPEVIVHAVDGPKAAAPLLEIGADFAVKLGGKQRLTIRGLDLISLHRAGVPQPASCPPPFLELTTGDRLPLADPVNIQLDDESVQATLAAPLTTGKFVVPQAAVALIALTSAAEPMGKRTLDSIVLKNGDALAGKLAGLNREKGVRLVVSGQTLIVPLDRVAQIAFNPEFQAHPRAKATYADVVLAGGARVSLAKLTTVGPGGQLSAVSLLGHSFTFAAVDLVALRIRQGKAVYLDELKPLSYTSTPFLDVAWPLATGRTLLGRPLKIGDNTYPFGLTLHSRSQVNYGLEQSYKWFEALVAVDAAAGPRAAVKIDVELDGKPVPGAARLLTKGDAPVALRIDVQSAKTLALIADFGPRGDIQGHVIWADARLVR